MSPILLTHRHMHAHWLFLFSLVHITLFLSLSRTHTHAQTHTHTTSTLQFCSILANDARQANLHTNRHRLQSFILPDQMKRVSHTHTHALYDVIK